MASVPFQLSKKWFTIVELLVGIFIISLVILAVLSMVRAASGHINKIRQETVAINLAREGMEAMYTRRNTNRLQHPAEKDKYRLCTNNSCDKGRLNNDGTSYILQYQPDGEIVFSDMGSTNIFKDGNFLIRPEHLIGTKPNGNYYRAILPLWLYQKDVNMTWWHQIYCTSWDENYSKLNFDWSDAGSTPCSDSTPKEFLFCSRVEYEGIGAGNGNVELCWSITNYME